MTVGAIINSTPVNLTTTLSLEAGLTYRLAALGRLPVRVSIGATWDQVNAQELRPGEPFEVTAPADPVWAKGPGTPMRVSAIRLRDELGPPRDKRRIAAGNDYAPGGSFVAQAATAGTVTYLALDGDAQQTETLAAGDSVQVAGVPVRLRSIIGSGTQADIDVGLF